MDLNAVMERLVRMGPTNAMREDERAAGHQVIVPGEVAWLSPEDWPEHVVVSVTQDRHVRIVAIKAHCPGNGSLSRLVDAIHKAGLIPAIVEPMLDMPAILQRWGWCERIIGSGMQRESQWLPPEGWFLLRTPSPENERRR